MFGLFKKKEQPTPYNDLVYFNDKGKKMALWQQIKQNRPLVLVSSFAETISLWRQVLEKQGRTHALLHSLADITDTPCTYLLHTDQLEQLSPSPTAPKVNLAVLEHYPLLDTDINILDKLSSIFANPQPVVYLSLDDPLMQNTGAERIKMLLAKMGINEDEAISHTMISASVKKAQLNQSQLVQNEQKTDSETEWYRINLPQPTR